MGNKWVHRLDWYDEDTLTGECVECGLVRVVKKKNYDRYTYKCAVAVKEQRGEFNPANKKYAYKNNDGTTVYLKKNQRQEIMSVFGDRCEICGEQPEVGLKLDHCHDSGQFRGVLCNHCNVGLGAFKDKEELLTAAIKYLKDSVDRAEQVG